MSQGDVALHTLRQRINRCAHTERILGQLSFANEMSKANDGRCDDFVAKASQRLLDQIQADGCVDQAGALAAEEILSPLSEKAKAYTMRSHRARAH